MADPVNLKSDEQVHGHIDSFTDASGNPATVDAPPVWSSSDPAIFTVNASADGMDVDVVAADMAQDAPAQTAQLTMKAKEGGVDDAIVMTFDVVVSSLTSPLATGANISFGTPTKKNP